MQFKLHSKRAKAKAGVLLVIIAVGAGLVIVGFGFKKIISFIGHVDKNIQRAATNCEPDLLVMEIPQPDPVVSQSFQVQNAIAPNSTATAHSFQVNTNYYNEALEDESGF